MPRLVQIRGTTGAGKTTAMRGAIERAGGGEIAQMKGSRLLRPCTVTPEFLALGDYKAKVACTGTDRFTDADDTKHVLKSALEARMYDKIAFEGMIISHTYKYAAEVAKMAARYGYDTRFVFLNVEYETALSRIFERNNAKPINYDMLFQKLRMFRVSEEKLIRAGFDCVVIEADDMTKEQVADAVYEAIVS